MWHGYAVTSSTLLADPPSNETIDVFYINKLTTIIFVVSSYMFRLTRVIFRLEQYLFTMSLCSFWDPRRLHVLLNRCHLLYYNWWLYFVLLTEYYAGGKIEKNEMGGACGAYGAGERDVQSSGGET